MREDDPNTSTPRTYWIVHGNSLLRVAPGHIRLLIQDDGKMLQHSLDNMKIAAEQIRARSTAQCVDLRNAPGPPADVDTDDDGDVEEAAPNPRATATRSHPKGPPAAANESIHGESQRQPPNRDDAMSDVEHEPEGESLTTTPPQRGETNDKSMLKDPRSSGHLRRWHRHGPETKAKETFEIDQSELTWTQRVRVDTTCACGPCS